MNVRAGQINLGQTKWRRIEVDESQQLSLLVATVDRLLSTLDELHGERWRLTMGEPRVDTVDRQVEIRHRLSVIPIEALVVELDAVCLQLELHHRLEKQSPPETVEDKDERMGEWMRLERRWDELDAEIKTATNGRLDASRIRPLDDLSTQHREHVLHLDPAYIPGLCLWGGAGQRMEANFRQRYHPCKSDE